VRIALGFERTRQEVGCEGFYGTISVMSDTKSMTTKQHVLVTLIGVVFVLFLVSLAVSGGSSKANQVEVDRDTCLQRGDVWSETNQTCYESTA